MASFDIETVLAQLTVPEKVSLLGGADNWHTQAIERLNVPLIRVSDGPNGIRGTQFFNGTPAACLPCGTALGATFDKALLEDAGRLMALEAKHKGAHVILGPTCNMQRSPLGGRGFESFAEDPVLSGLSTASIITGMQSEGVAATVKHYVCNDMEEDRSFANAVVTQRALRETYLMPFQLAIRDANPKALMTSYGMVNGEHASQSKHLLQDILRDEWKWEGLVMSDWFGCYSMKAAMDAGLDLEMPGKPLVRTANSMAHAITNKEIHMKVVNERVRAVLRLVQYCQGSGIAEHAPEDANNNTPETAARLRTLAASGIVLLKNDNNVLPLQKSETIAVIGPNAKNKAYSGGGSASLLPYYTVTPYDGISAKAGKPVPYTIGATNHKVLPPPLLVRADGSAGYTASFFHEPRGSPNRTKFDSLDLSGGYHVMMDYNHPEAGSKVYVDFEGDFTPEMDAVYEFGTASFGDSQVFVNDQVVVDNKTLHTFGGHFFNMGTFEARGTMALKAGVTYRFRVEHGSPGTSSHYPNVASAMSGAGGVLFGVAPVLDPQVAIEQAVALAKTVDKVVLVIGLNQEWETESFDRADMRLPGATDALVAAVAKVNPNVVVVNQTGTPVEFPWIEDVAAVVQAWYGGNEMGNAMADVLYGDFNPSGKLPLSWPKRVQDNPAYINFRSNKGQVLYGEDIYVGYKYYEKVERPALYPFGYGLSYTSFGFLDLEASLQGAELCVRVKVLNTGGRVGATTVQVYVGAVASSVERPLKELREFAKVTLAPGETQLATLLVPVKYALSFFDEYEQQWNCEKGDYVVSVGDSSASADLQTTLTLDEGFLWSGL